MNEETAALDHYSIKLLIIKEIPLLLLKLLLWRLNSTRFLGVHVTDNLLQCQSSPAPALPTEAKKKTHPNPSGFTTFYRVTAESVAFVCNMRVAVSQKERHWQDYRGLTATIWGSGKGTLPFMGKKDRDGHHSPGHWPFSLLPSGKRYRSIMWIYPTAIRLVNS